MERGARVHRFLSSSVAEDTGAVAGLWSDGYHRSRHAPHRLADDLQPAGHAR